MNELVGHDNLPSVLMQIVGALIQFTMARLGGIPVPMITLFGTVFWTVYMTLQSLQWVRQRTTDQHFPASVPRNEIVCPFAHCSRAPCPQLTVALSIVMEVLMFSALRRDTYDCLISGVGVWSEWKVVDVAFWTTIASNPSIIGRALVLFIYAYAFSSGIKVFLRAWEFHFRSKHQKEEDLNLFRDFQGLPRLSGEMASVQADDFEPSDFAFKVKSARLTPSAQPLTGANVLQLRIYYTLDHARLHPILASQAELKNTPQRIYFATLHALVAYAGLVITLLFGLLSGALLTGICYAPVSLGIIAVRTRPAQCPTNQGQSRLKPWLTRFF